MQSQVKIGKKAKTRAAYWKKFGGGWVVAGLVENKKYLSCLAYIPGLLKNITCQVYLGNESDL